MRHSLKFLHLIGTTLFLGSITIYILISVLAGNTNLNHLIFARQIIRTSTLMITIPSMWLTIISGCAIVFYQFKGPKRYWIKVKLIIALLILLNAHFVILPTTGNALAIATKSLQNSQLLTDFNGVHLKESIFGAFNALFILASIFFGLWKPNRLTNYLKRKLSN